MDAKANIQIGNVNNADKQKVSLTYCVGPFDTVEESQSCKYALDQVSKKYGAEVHEDARIISDELDKEAKEDSIDKTEEAPSVIPTTKTEAIIAK